MRRRLHASPPAFTQQGQTRIEVTARPLPATATSMLSPRISLADDSPNTQRTASMMLDLPQPFGPTTPTSCPGSMKLVGSTKDLKPESLIEFRRTRSTDM